MTREELIKDIREHPERHRHSFSGLQACCMQASGALDLMLMELHGRYVNLGTNGGIRCDVTDGPCACGAWH